MRDQEVEGKNANFGVNVAGYFKAESGLGEGARATVRALEAAGIPYVLNSCEFNLQYHNEDKGDANQKFSRENPYPINIIQINPEAMFKFNDDFGKDYGKGKYNIGFWYWEMLRFPKEWEFAFSYFDEVWTGSNFCVEAISKVSPVPVVKVPPSVVLNEPNLSREDIGLPKNRFIFSFIFDFGSKSLRKNPLGALEAFHRAFGKDNTDVLFVMKYYNSDFEKDVSAKIREIERTSKNVKVIDRSMPREELTALVYHTDCYVSLHRAEGFGLTMAESMFFGKPVIATNYSSNIDFMNISNSFPVGYKITELDHDLFHYRKGDLWADPDVDHAARQMRFVFDNPEEAKKIGERAKADIRENYSPEALGVLVKDRIERIFAFNNGFQTSEDEEAIGLNNDSIRGKVAFAEAEAFHLREKIRLMEESRFWKIRNQWFAAKRKLGLTRKY